MSEENTSDKVNKVVTKGNKDTANLIYILYLVGVIVGITGLVGVIMAYLNRGDAPEWLQSHYTYQIHTFWKMLLFTVIGVVLSVILIGILVMLAALVWYVIRCVKGMQFLGKDEAVPDPKTWMF